MSHFFFILALILITGAAFPQKSIRSSDTPSVKSESQRWTLDKYIWSYAQYKGEKNEKCLIDFNTIDNWQGMSDYLSISDNGKYFAYGIESGVGLPDNYRKLDS